MDNMQNLTVLLTSKCTLKCKLCATYAPLKKLPCHYPSNIVIKSVARYFECIDMVNLFTLSGGEPFLHPELDILLSDFQQYENRLNKFEIITNGTVLPDNSILELLKFSDKVDILIDDYGPTISVNVRKLTEQLDRFCIHYRVRKYYGEDAHLGGWLNISDFSEKARSPKEIEELFSQCMYTTTFKNHIFIINGTAHMCYVNHQLLDFIDEKGDEYVNLVNESITANELRSRLLNLRNRKYLSVCENCNGFLVDGKRYAPAEQMK